MFCSHDSFYELHDHRTKEIFVLGQAESGQAGAYPPVMNLHVSPTHCATSVKLRASSWYLCFYRQCWCLLVWGSERPVLLCARDVLFSPMLAHAIQTPYGYHTWRRLFLVWNPAFLLSESFTVLACSVFNAVLFSYMLHIATLIFPSAETQHHVLPSWSIPCEGFPFIKRLWPFVFSSRRGHGCLDVLEWVLCRHTSSRLCYML